MAGLDDVVNTGLGDIDKAMGIAKASLNSNWFKEFGEKSDMNHIQTLGEYYRKQPGREGKMYDTDKADDDKLNKYLVITVDDPNHVLSEDGKVDIIIDNTGHDVARSYLSVDGQKLEISPKILDNNGKMLEGIELALGEMSIEDLKKMMTPKDLEGLVTEIEKHDSVEYASEKDAAERVNEKRPELGAKEKEKEKEEPKEGELSEEEIEAKAKQSGDIPEEQLGLIVKICKENGLDPSKLKQCLTFEDPNVLLEDMDNSRTDLNPYNGAVMALRFKDAGLSGKDKVVLIQNEKQLKYDSGNDQAIAEKMEKNKGNNITIAHNYNDGHKDDIASRVDEKLEEMKEKIKSLNDEISKVKEMPDGVFDGKAETISKIEDQKENVKATYENEIVSEVSEKFPCKEAIKQADLADEKVSEAAKEAEEENKESGQKEQEDDGIDERDNATKRLNGIIDFNKH